MAEGGISKGAIATAGAVVALMLPLLGLVWSASNKLTRIEVAVERLEEQHAPEDEWSSKDMRHWAELLAAHNPDINVPLPQAGEE
jgi:hypothetical protein